MKKLPPDSGMPAAIGYHYFNGTRTQLAADLNNALPPEDTLRQRRDETAPCRI
jgi:hypothetical protein